MKCNPPLLCACSTVFELFPFSWILILGLRTVKRYISPFWLDWPNYIQWNPVKYYQYFTGLSNITLAKKLQYAFSSAVESYTVSFRSGRVHYIVFKRNAVPAIPRLSWSFLWIRLWCWLLSQRTFKGQLAVSGSWWNCSFHFQIMAPTTLTQKFSS